MSVRRSRANMTELVQNPQRWPLFPSIHTFAIATLSFHTMTATTANDGLALTIRSGSVRLSTNTVTSTDTLQQAATTGCQKEAGCPRVVAVVPRLDIVRTLIHPFIVLEDANMYLSRVG